jgi:hypothetical protein
MFEFVKTLTVRRLVKVLKPADGEGYITMECHVTWEILPVDDNHSFTPEFFEKVIKNIEGPVDASTKQAIPFTDEFKRDFVHVSYILSGLTKEYLACTHTAGRGN